MVTKNTGILTHKWWTSGNKILKNFKNNNFFQEISFENVTCKMAAILFRPEYVKVYILENHTDLVH